MENTQYGTAAGCHSVGAIRTAKGTMRPRQGQAAVEFALVLTVAMIVLFVAIQMALIGQVALALGQMNYQGARWAAVNPCATASDIASYMVCVGSPTVTQNCSNLTVTVVDSNGGPTPGTPTCPAGSAPPTCVPTPATSCSSPRAFSSQLTVNVSYNAKAQLVLPNPFLGINFPTNLQSQETAMSE
jgi:Flp pilus assembly protein TadG